MDADNSMTQIAPNRYQFQDKMSINDPLQQYNMRWCTTTEHTTLMYTVPDVRTCGIVEVWLDRIGNGLSNKVQPIVIASVIDNSSEYTNGVLVGWMSPVIDEYATMTIAGIVTNGEEDSVMSMHLLRLAVVLARDRGVCMVIHEPLDDRWSPRYAAESLHTVGFRQEPGASITGTGMAATHSDPYKWSICTVICALDISPAQFLSWGLDGRRYEESSEALSTMQHNQTDEKALITVLVLAPSSDAKTISKKFYATTTDDDDDDDVSKIHQPPTTTNGLPAWRDASMFTGVIVAFTVTVSTNDTDKDECTMDMTSVCVAPGTGYLDVDRQLLHATEMHVQRASSGTCILKHCTQLRGMPAEPKAMYLWKSMGYKMDLEPSRMIHFKRLADTASPQTVAALQKPVSSEAPKPQQAARTYTATYIAEGGTGGASTLYVASKYKQMMTNASDDRFYTEAEQLADMYQLSGVRFYTIHDTSCGEADILAITAVSGDDQIVIYASPVADDALKQGVQAVVREQEAHTA